ncbi:MAG: hypothetical protein LUG86_00605 [Oscillospiraceae bacterium]|nr:hypothetical protein [Oscillospiraceae bacterium]
MTSLTFVILMLIAIVPVVLVIAGLILALGQLFKLFIRFVPSRVVTAVASISLIVGIICMLYIVISGTAAIILACASMALVIWGVYALLNRTK